MMRFALMFALCLPLPVQAEIVPPPDHDVYVLGEVHDNSAHHAEQARLVGLIAPKAVIWEMLLPQQVVALARTNRADPTAMAAALDWEASGWPDFAMYHPIFVAAGDVPHLGAGVSREDLQMAMKDGAASMMGMDLPPFAPDVQAALQAEQASAHCNALPADLLPGMVQAQRLRDATLAGTAMQALLDHGGPVVIITGTGHARTDTGAPAILRAMEQQSDVVLKVWSLGQVESDPGPDAPFDAVNVTAPAMREDPCQAFAPSGG